MECPTNNIDTRTEEVEMSISEAFIKFAEDYIWQHGYTRSTADNYKWALTSFTKAVGDIKLIDITPEDIVTWRKFMEAKQYEWNAINSFLYRMRLFLRYYRKLVELSINPDEIIIPKNKKTLPKFLTIEDVQAMIEVADPRGKAIVSLLYSSGIRVGELCRLRRKDIHGDMIKIRGKGDKERMAFLDHRARDALNIYLAARHDVSPFLFYSRKGKGLGTAQIQRLVHQIGVDAAIDQSVTPHVLRHSFATHMAQAGCNAYHLKEMLGHADISTTQIYVHLTSVDLKKAYKKFHTV